MAMEMDIPLFTDNEKLIRRISGREFVGRAGEVKALPSRRVSCAEWPNLS